MENATPEDLAALAKLEQTKRPPTDMHMFQSAQRLASVLLQRKDYASCLRACLILERWTVSQADATQQRQLLPRDQLCKVELWQYLIQLQCLLSLFSSSSSAGSSDNAATKETTRVMLKAGKALLSLLLASSSSVVDAATHGATCTKFRQLVSHAKCPLEVQVFALRVMLELPSSSDDAAAAAADVEKTVLPGLIQKLRTSKTHSMEAQATIEALLPKVRRLPFEFAIWVYECTQQCDALCTWARTEKEVLFAAHCCDKQGLYELASRTCARALRRSDLSPPPSAASALVSFHVKNLCLQPNKPGVLLLAQHAAAAREGDDDNSDGDNLYLHAEAEFALFAQFRKLPEYVARHTAEHAIDSLLHAKAWRLLQDPQRAWDVLQEQQPHQRRRDLFLECQLQTELRLDCSHTARELQEELAAQQQRQPNDASEMKAWLELHGYGYTRDYFARQPAAPAALAIAKHDDDVHRAMRALLLSVDELRKQAKPEQEYQTLASVLAALQQLGDLHQNQGLSAQARYFYSKALVLANSRHMWRGESQRLMDKLEVVQVREGRPEAAAAADKGAGGHDDDEGRLHLARVHAAAISSQAPYPTSDGGVPHFLQTCRYEMAVILFHQRQFAACFQLLDEEDKKHKTCSSADTLKVRAFLQQTESSVTNKKLGELIRSCVVGGDVITLAKCYEYLLVNAGGDQLSGEEQAYLVCASVGMTSRFAELAVNTTTNNEEEDDNLFRWHELASIKHSARQQRKTVKSRLPADWAVCTLMVAEDQQSMYLCRTERAREFVFEIDCPGLPDLLGEFTAIMAKNGDQLDNCTLEFAKTRSQRAKDKWWNDRFELDAELDDWLQRFDRECLSWHTVFLRGGSSTSSAQLETALHDANLATEDERELARLCLTSGLACGTVSKALAACCPSAAAEWADNAALKFCGKSAPPPPPTTTQQRGPVLLCLSGVLQQIPFESLPCLHLQRVSRIPSLPFALRGQGGERRPAKLNMAYIVDPDDSLKRTQDALRERLEEMRETGLCSEGLIGKPESSSADASSSSDAQVASLFKRCLTSSSLVLYCGHGSGEQFLDPRKCVDNEDDDGGGEQQVPRWRSWAPAILMGCSSASRKPLGVFEPNGRVVDAYMRRCPLVVGTLWNVSDVDIDRFTLAMLDGIKEGEGDLLHLVAHSRQVCKLRKLVGSATVCFGLPWNVQ